jgi:hypothetical protein
MQEILLETFAKVLIVDEVQGARNAETETVRAVRRGCEYRATQQLAARSTFAKVSFRKYT